MKKYFNENIINNNIFVTDQEIIDDYNILKQKYGIITSEIIDEHSKLSRSMYYDRFGSFSNINIINNKIIKTKVRKYSNQELIDDYKKLKNEHGKVTQSIINKYGVCTLMVHKRRFGCLGNFKKEFGLEMD